MSSSQIPVRSLQFTAYSSDNQSSKFAVQSSLSGRRAATRAQIVRNIIESKVLDREEFKIEQIDTVHDALARYRKGNADFGDCLIASSARAAGCARTVTFDRVAARDAGMEPIG